MNACIHHLALDVRAKARLIRLKTISVIVLFKMTVRFSSLKDCLTVQIKRLSEYQEQNLSIQKPILNKDSHHCLFSRDMYLPFLDWTQTQTWCRMVKWPNCLFTNCPFKANVSIYLNVDCGGHFHFCHYESWDVAKFFLCTTFVSFSSVFYTGGKALIRKLRRSISLQIILNFSTWREYLRG